MNVSVLRKFGEYDDYDIWLRNVSGSSISHSYRTGWMDTFPERLQWLEDPISFHLI
jgi:hypothetical protein